MKFMGWRQAAIASMAIVAITGLSKPAPARAGPSAPRPRELTRAKILSAIHAGTQYLLKKCKRKIFWESVPPGGYFSGGPTALSVYALLQVGLATGDARFQPDSPLLKPAIKYLIQLHARGTYAAALQLAALTSEPISMAGCRLAIHRAASYLIDAEHTNGAYDYDWTGKKPHQPQPSRWDNSNTQYGVLGVWCAQAAGYIYPHIGYWQRAEKHWKKCQDADGGWCYQGRGLYSTRSMTAAGLATLFIVNEYLHPGLEIRTRRNPAINRAMAWLTKNIKTQSNLYYLYGLERVGLASGLRFIGHRNWYRMGARIILKAQSTTGQWTSGVQGAPSNIVPTAYALLFLARGLNPVIFNKLSYPGPWNARARDDQNITSWIGNTLEENLNWGVVDIHSNPHHWLNAPILLITGYGQVHFTPRQIARIRWFIEHGGMVFSTSDDNSAAFTRSICKAANQIIPGQTMHLLSKNSAVYDIQYSLPAKMQFMGLNNGLRSVWVHSPHDLSAAWQTMETVTQADDFQAAENVYLYATGEKKLLMHIHLRHAPPSHPPAFAIHAAIVRHAGIWNPDPAAFVALSRFALRHGVKLTFSTTMLPALQTASPQQMPVAYFIALGKLKLSSRDIHAMAAYIQRGGSVIMENAAGSRLCMKSLQSLSAKVFPVGLPRRLHWSKKMFHSQVSPSIFLRHLHYTAFYARYHAPSRKIPIWAVNQNHRDALFISGVAIASQWIDGNYWGVRGLSTRSARRVALDLLIYAARHSPAKLNRLLPLIAKAKPAAAKPQPISAPPPPRPRPPVAPTIQLR